MKRRHLQALLTIATSLVCLIAMKPVLATAQATNPVCYINTSAGGNDSFLIVDCNGSGLSPNFAQLSQKLTGNNLQSLHCYIIASNVWALQEYTIGSQQCNNAQNLSTNKGDPGAVGSSIADATGTAIPGSHSSGAATGGTQASDSGSSSLGAAAGQAGADAADAQKQQITNCKKSDGTSSKNCLADNPLIQELVKIFNLLSALVGIVVIGVIIFGGIQYSASHGDPQAVAQARKRITNAVLALIAYLFFFALLQYLIPGGPF